MTNDLAKQTLVILVNNSSFFRGVLFAREAWGYNGFPSEKEQKELQNLVSLLKELAEALDEEKL